MSAAGDTASSLSGPRVARLFQALLSLTFLTAWLSLGSQIDLLVGHRGLLPIEPLVERLQEREIGFTQFPSLLLYGASDGTLHTLVTAGVLLSFASGLGLFPRLAFALNTLFYGSVAIACQNFLTFQWDNLLLECGLLASFLRGDREQRWLHFAFRVLLFKLYFESGLAKYQSHLGDWHDGSAMSYYYETAPIPTALGWFMHQWPAGFHKLESWLTLFWEIGAPFAIFAPRPLRLLAFLVFSCFQLVNILTANYGFFSYLALFLQAFLLGERDCLALARGLRSRLAQLPAPVIRMRQALHWLAVRRRWLVSRAHAPARRVASSLRMAQRKWLQVARQVATGSFLAAYLTLSLHGGLLRFARGALPDEGFFKEVLELYAPYRLVNTYHLFAQITRQRVEPQFEVSSDEGARPLSMHYKPGPLDRAPPFVAPHQPRVDFLLWFYGLSHRRGTPTYVQAILRRLCDDPEIVQPLFVERLPKRPKAARVVFHSYRFTTWDEHDATGNWWKREPVEGTINLPCKRF